MLYRVYHHSSFIYKVYSLVLAGDDAEIDVKVVSVSAVVEVLQQN